MQGQKSPILKPFLTPSNLFSSLLKSTAEFSKAPVKPPPVGVAGDVPGTSSRDWISLASPFLFQVFIFLNSTCGLFDLSWEIQFRK